MPNAANPDESVEIVAKPPKRLSVTFHWDGRRRARNSEQAIQFPPVERHCTAPVMATPPQLALATIAPHLMRGCGDYGAGITFY